MYSMRPGSYNNFHFYLKFHKQPLTIHNIVISPESRLLFRIFFFFFFFKSSYLVNSGNFFILEFSQHFAYLMSLYLYILFCMLSAAFVILCCIFSIYFALVFVSKSWWMVKGYCYWRERCPYKCQGK